MSIGFSFPFKNSTQGGVLASTNTSKDAIRTDLIYLLTTRRGHRPMRNGLFSPLYDYINEQIDDSTIFRMKSDLEDKISEYIPEVVIRQIDIKQFPDDSRVEIEIKYSISSLGNILDFVNISMLTETEN